MELSKRPLIFSINKPSNMTSNDVIYYFKKNLNFKFGKIGHFGTLDPFASGVLLVGIQGAQKINDYIHELFPKTYTATGFFGEKTLSGDFLTEVTDLGSLEPSWQNASCNEIDSYIKDKFVGEYWQRPHQVSASKFEGKRLYEYARAGVHVEKNKVKREILNFRVLEYAYPLIKFEVTVSSGTYVRSFFEDMSSYMGGVGHLKELVRTSVGDILIENSLRREEWPTFKSPPQELINNSYQIDQVLKLNRIELDDEKSRRFLQGVRFRQDQIEIMHNVFAVNSQKYFWIYQKSGHLLGLAQINNSELQAIFTFQNYLL